MIGSDSDNGNFELASKEETISMFEVIWVKPNFPKSLSGRFP